MFLSEAVEALLIATRADGRSLRTVQAYREKLGHLLRFLGDVPVAGITVHDLRRYVVDMRERETRYSDHPTHREIKGGLSQFTIASRVIAMKRLFNWLVEEELIQLSPARKIRTPRPRRREPKGISWDDVLALLATTESGSIIDLRDRALILLLADSGCRLGGLCGLQILDVDLINLSAIITEKGDKAQPVFFTRTTANALSAWLEVRPEDRGPCVFVSLRTNATGGLSPNGVAQMLSKRAQQADVVGRANAHAFRHGFARYYLRDGGDLGTLSDLLGHSSVEVTKAFYGIFTAEELQRKHARHSPVTQLNERNTDE